MPGRRRVGIFASLIAIAATVCMGAGSAQAATVIVGSPMPGPFVTGTLGDNGSTQTVANTALFDSSAHVTSPVTGTIISWRMVALNGGDGSSYAIRVLRPQGDGSYLGAGKSATVEASGDQTFSTSLPIQVGDLVALDLGDGNGVNGTPFPGATWVGWDPALPEGTSDFPNPIIGENSGELAFNATVQYSDSGPPPPGNTTTPAAKKKCKRKKKHKRSAESAKKKCKKKRKR